MRKLLFTFAMCLLTFAACTQDISFESLKAQLCDKSLPLINLNVEIDKVSKPEYTNATIEIADPQKRTDKVNRKLLGLKKTGKDDDGKPVIKGVLYKGKEWGPATFLYGYKDEGMNGAMWNGWELEYPEDHPCPDAYMPLKDFIDYSENSSDDEFKSGINKRFY